MTKRARRKMSGAKNSSCSGEYVRAMVVQVRERKTRLMDVDQEESMGIAKREARGRVSGVRRAVRDILFELEMCDWG